jgi:hypothetical protein
MWQSCCFWESRIYSSLINQNVNICHLIVLTCLFWHLLFLLKVYISGAQRFLAAGCSDKSDVVKCHKAYLNIILIYWKMEFYLYYFHLHYIMMNCKAPFISNNYTVLFTFWRNFSLQFEKMLSEPLLPFLHFMIFLWNTFI